MAIAKQRLRDQMEETFHQAMYDKAEAFYEGNRCHVQSKA